MASGTTNVDAGSYSLCPQVRASSITRPHGGTVSVSRDALPQELLLTLNSHLVGWAVPEGFFAQGRQAITRIKDLRAFYRLFSNQTIQLYPFEGMG